MSAPDQTLRYRGDSLAYSVALLFLLEHARASADDFSYGPVDLDALDAQGLVVSGPRLDSVAKVLAGIPGLYRSEE